MQQHNKKHPPSVLTRASRRVGRPSVSDRDRREPLSVSLPRWQWDSLEEMAKEHGLSRSSMIADAVGMWLKGGAK
jgi:hypothetical protein